MSYRPIRGDAFGQALRDRLDDASGSIVVERDDGYVDVDDSDYFGDVSPGGSTLP